MSNRIKRFNGTTWVTIYDEDLANVNSFATVAVSGQSNVVADSPTDILTLAAGTGMSIATNATTDTVTFATNGTSSNSANSLVLRGTNGEFSAGVVSATGLTVTGGGSISTGTLTSSSDVTVNGTNLYVGPGTGASTLHLRDIANAGWRLTTGGFALGFQNDSPSGTFATKMSLSNTGKLTVNDGIVSPKPIAMTGSTAADRTVLGPQENLTATLTSATYSSVFATHTYVSSAPHNLRTDDVVTITGFSPSGFNKTNAAVIVQSPTQFFVALQGNPGQTTATGTGSLTSTVQRANLTVRSHGVTTVDRLQHDFMGVAIQSTPQTILDSTWTAIQFNGADEYDYAGMHDPSVNNNRINIPIAGVWLFWAMVTLANSVNGSRDMQIRRYSSAGTLLQAWAGAFDAGDSASDLITTATASFLCDAGDMIEVWYFHDSSASRATVVNTDTKIQPKVGWTLLRAS